MMVFGHGGVFFSGSSWLSFRKGSGKGRTEANGRMLLVASQPFLSEFFFFFEVSTEVNRWLTNEVMVVSWNEIVGPRLLRYIVVD